jgi:hypothetical protein
VDGVVLVIRERFSSAANVTDALSLMKGSRILGAVYNEVMITADNDRYGSYYGGYRYGHSVSQDGKVAGQEKL